MPIAAPKPCKICSTLVHDGSTRCDAHKLAPWRQTAAYKRTSGRRLQKQRADLFRREPFCRECRKAGRFTIAVIRDHIKPLAEDGSDDDDNVQPLCQHCSDAKTAAERARGIDRTAGVYMGSAIRARGRGVPRWAKS